MSVTLRIQTSALFGAEISLPLSLLWCSLELFPAAQFGVI